MKTIVFLVALLPVGAQPPFGGGPNASPPKIGVETRKLMRDRIVAAIGPEAVGFIREYGDGAVVALFNCTPPTGKRLVHLCESGKLDVLISVPAALEAIGKAGEPAAAWFVNHHERLAEPDCFECWCREPLEYVFELKDLEQQAARLNASRPPITSWDQGGIWENTTVGMVLGGLCLLMGVVMLLKHRSSILGN